MATCKKESFSLKSFADKAIEIYNGKYNRKNPEKKLTRSYLCKQCGQYHLTSQDNYQTKLRIVEKELHETKLLLASRESELFSRIDKNKKLENENKELKRKLQLKDGK